MKKKRRMGEAEVTGTLLTVFGGDSYKGESFPLPGESQLSMTDMLSPTPVAMGNRSCAFPEVLSLQEKTGIPVRRPLDNAVENRWFSLVCGKTDPVAVAAKSMLTLMQYRQVHRFLVLVRGMAEREDMALSLSVYLRSYAGLMPQKPSLLVYNPPENDIAEEGLSLLRRYVCDPAPQILLMNREYYNRPENLLLKPLRQLDDRLPITLLQMAHPVVITVSDTAEELRMLLQSSTVFEPLCTLSFVEKPDTTGTTVPIYVPGMTVDKPNDVPEQIQM